MPSDSLLETHMIDISAKPTTHRTAKATAKVSMNPKTLQAIVDKEVIKGDVLVIAQVAGIQAAKKCSDLIPLCHPLLLSSVQIELEPDFQNSALLLNAQVKVTGQTGVEMEALTAVSVAALTVYDMCKGIDKEMTIGEIMLLEKQGGKSGFYQRESLDELVR